MKTYFIISVLKDSVFSWGKKKRPVSINVSASVLFSLCVIDHKMHQCAAKLAPHLVSMRTLARPRVAMYSTQGIRGNLPIRARRGEKGTIECEER